MIDSTIMVKVISQETYDAVVKENMEEFGLSLDEARKDAIEQFQSQVIDFWLQFLYCDLMKTCFFLGC